MKNNSLWLLFLLSLGIIITSCDAAEPELDEQRANLKGAEEEDEDDEEPALPQVVSGAFLTCSMEDVSVGCNLSESEGGAVIPKVEPSIEFLVSIGTKEITVKGEDLHKEPLNGFSYSFDLPEEVAESAEMEEVSVSSNASMNKVGLGIVRFYLFLQLKYQKAMLHRAKLMENHSTAALYEYSMDSALNCASNKIENLQGYTNFMAENDNAYSSANPAYTWPVIEALAQDYQNNWTIPMKDMLETSYGAQNTYEIKTAEILDVYMNFSAGPFQTLTDIYDSMECHRDAISSGDVQAFQACNEKDTYKEAQDAFNKVYKEYFVDIQPTESDDKLTLSELSLKESMERNETIKAQVEPVVRNMFIPIIKKYCNEDGHTLLDYSIHDDVTRRVFRPEPELCQFVADKEYHKIDFNECLLTTSLAEGGSSRQVLLESLEKAGQEGI